ncbi:MAG TPA: hypothetical protein VFA90_01910 [Terriglobales bacterium]|nr:hypothetical protein [Terriglobales bacterium]
MNSENNSAKAGVHVQIDRVQIVSWAPQGQKPPSLAGFKIMRDCFVCCQTTTPTYARCRQYRSLIDDTQIYWQYERRKGWLKPWKVTVIADDRRGLSYNDIELILIHCRHYRFLTVEMAIDFSPATGIGKQFVRRYAIFGKSRRRANK